MLTLLIAIAASILVATLGYREARNFTRRRLRFVDAVQSPMAPFIAGTGAALLGALVAALLPVVGIGTALSFGIAVGMGVSSGAKDAKKGYYLAD